MEPFKKMNIPINTLFNPSITGALHLGHIFIAKVNECEAHRAGGKFFVRFDDTQPYWMERVGWDKIRAYKGQILAELEWFGIEVDGVSSQSEMQIEAHSRLVARCNEAGMPVPVDRYGDTVFPEVTWNKVHPYPFTPFKTAEKVIMDDMMDITLKIRGEDIYGEFGIYCLYREMFRMFQPRQVFVSRLEFPEGHVVSKREANCRIEDYMRGGVSRSALLYLLAEACLEVPEKGWYIDNLIKFPVWRGDGEQKQAGF